MPIVSAGELDRSGTMTTYHHSPFATGSTPMDGLNVSRVSRAAQLLHHLRIELQRLGEGKVDVFVGHELHPTESSDA